MVTCEIGQIHPEKEGATFILSPHYIKSPNNNRFKAPEDTHMTHCYHNQKWSAKYATQTHLRQYIHFNIVLFLRNTLSD